MRTAIILAIGLFSASAQSTQRSTSVKHEFHRATPCPANGNTRGACPGYVIDHIVPLCAGGPDHPGNMQWQTVADAKVKDREEVKRCRAKQ